jgi:sirohydrochlorin ferrochelatase
VKRAIVLVDHGSRKTAANEALVEIAALVAARAGEHVIVRAAHMELAPPTVAEAFDACVAAGATHVDVMPYFLFAGRHATEDIPALAREAASKHPHVTYRVAEPLGIHPALAQIVIDRCRAD